MSAKKKSSKKSVEIDTSCIYCKKNDKFECDIFDNPRDSCWYLSFVECREALRKRNLDC